MIARRRARRRHRRRGDQGGARSATAPSTKPSPTPIAKIGENMSLRRAASLSVGAGRRSPAMCTTRCPKGSARSACWSRSSRPARRTSSRASARRSRCMSPPPIRRRSIRRRSTRTSSAREGRAGREGQGAGQAGKRHREDRRIRAQDLLQGGLPARSGLHPSTPTRASRRRSRRPKARSARRSRSPAIVRYALGEGIERPETDFAAEVAAAVEAELSARHRCQRGRHERRMTRPRMARAAHPSERIMAEPIYRRVIVKVSGEALMGPDGFGIHQPTLERIAADLVAAQRARGRRSASWSAAATSFAAWRSSEKGIPRVTGDMMGMLATVMNALALEAALEQAGATRARMSALAMPEVCETYERQRALRHLDEGRMRDVRRRHRQSVLHHRYRRRCCARPKSAPTRCSRRPMSMASTAPTRRRTRSATRYDA